MLEIIGVLLGIVIADIARPVARMGFAIRILTAMTTVVVVSFLPVQGAIVDLIVAFGLRLAWAQLINGTTGRAQP
ncbi:hypothetical protein [Burkholderia cenocepacia]|uniref:hypothetical protein n=1 Tax=Burkholderia cenocepacia TaxID=95486 RepID=UPI002865F998|nr:hypothetical protein [Burkholderia cenocepacia]MDR8057692.1 hypothetical protein [Burkholderia cenocepacia]MDR8062216.1 hypothetical protein [Burkholderia cenocepacia]